MACFFAKAGEFVFVEAFFVFFEDLASSVEVLLLYKDVAPSAEGASCPSGSDHAVDAGVFEAGEEEPGIYWVGGCGEDLEHAFGG